MKYCVMLLDNDKLPFKISDFESAAECTDQVVWYLLNTPKNGIDFQIWSFEEWLQAYRSGKVR
jgi:hypothetical protein